MKTSTKKPQKAFVKLDEQVSLASSFNRVVKTESAGRALGFGCNIKPQK